MDGALRKAPLGGGFTARIRLTRAKRVKGSLLTEGKGIPIGSFPPGNRNDFKLARSTLESIPIERPEPTSGQLQELAGKTRRHLLRHALPRQRSVISRAANRSRLPEWARLETLCVSSGNNRILNAGRGSDAARAGVNRRTAPRQRRLREGRRSHSDRFAR
jgi:hypothetical protein